MTYSSVRRANTLKVGGTLPVKKLSCTVNDFNAVRVDNALDKVPAKLFDCKFSVVSFCKLDMR